MLLKGFPSCSIVRCFEISIDSLVFRAKYLFTGARRADLSQFIFWPHIQACIAIALFFDAALVVVFLSYRHIASAFNNLNQSAFTRDTLDTWLLVHVGLVIVGQQDLMDFLVCRLIANNLIVNLKHFVQG